MPFFGVFPRRIVMNIKIKALSENSYIPQKATDGAAAYDLRIPESYIVYPYPRRQVIPLQISMEIPEGYEAKIEARSGFSSKGMEAYDRMTEDTDGHSAEPHRYDCDVLTGKIDSDYRGCIAVIIYNRENRPFVIPKATRIAQLTIYKLPDIQFVQVAELSDTPRGKGGFGSTGTK